MTPGVALRVGTQGGDYDELQRDDVETDPVCRGARDCRETNKRESGQGEDEPKVAIVPELTQRRQLSGETSPAAPLRLRMGAPSDR